ncbi:Ankyrin repeat domain-containing protein 2B [Cardamine amara subsp. amara]|uniref:Ankyrin repeat domain-containing protein 2B n=1 Tax=Cardamine amara subsp. amara TaxID=228776 RepID=A0ABD1AFC2_CARAN
MASGSKKTLPLSADKKKLSKVKSKSTKPKQESGLGISADLGLNLNDFDFSGMPIFKEWAEKMAGETEFDQIEQLRRSIPTAWMKELLPDFDPEQLINRIRQNFGNPELRKVTENLVNHLLRDPQMSPGTLENVDSKTPVDVNKSAEDKSTLTR